MPISNIGIPNLSEDNIIPKAYDLYREPCPHQKTITPSSVLHARRPAIAARSRKSVVASKNLPVRGVDRRVVSANILSRRWHKTLLLEKGVLQKTPELHIPAPQYIPHLALIHTAWSPSSHFHVRRQVASGCRDGDGLDFRTVDLVPSANAEDIRDRWLRPYILPPLGQDEIPKVYHPFTLQYISRILSTYPRCMLKDKDVPPIIHRSQIEGKELPRSLANCYSLVRMWEQAVPGSEMMVMSTLEKEMERLAEEVPLHDDTFLGTF
ncbi:C6 finger domain protein [Aspergillus arachidicola]|uniref:C6 finger domain protein n=1 Tax=Aspergillus arachidicola TaxID=656916 RepID=A0A2G7FSC2_9EURO|nr:C6 finger domain protein [Aspergillus arachidicola]